jgi:hypothetical protein
VIALVEIGINQACWGQSLRRLPLRKYREELAIWVNH